MTVVLEADYQRYQFSFDFTQRCGPGHGRGVERVVRGQRPRVEGVHRHDVVDSTGISIDDLGMEFA